MGKCAHCKAPATNRYGLTTACSPDHAYAVLKARQEKKARALLLVDRKQNRADKLRIKTLATLCKEARTIVQKYARLRDQKWGACICCGVPKIEDGAHFFAAGSKYRTARLSLNPDQIMGSCAKCNRFVGGGNMDGYRAGILARYGPQKLAELQELKRRADSGEDAPLTKEEVAGIKANYSKLIRDMEQRLNAEPR